MQRLELKVTAVVAAAAAGQRALSEAQAEATAAAVAAEHEALTRRRTSELSEQSSAHLASEYEAAMGESARQAQALRELRDVIASTEGGRETVQAQMQARVDALSAQLKRALAESAAQEKALQARVAALIGESAKSKLQVAQEQTAGAQLAVTLELDTAARFESEIGEMQVRCSFYCCFRSFVCSAALLFAHTFFCSCWQRISGEEVASLAVAAVAMEAELGEKVAEAEARTQRALASVASEESAAVALRAELAALRTSADGSRFEQNALQQLLGVAMDRANTEAENASRADKRVATLDSELGATRLRLTALQSDAARAQARFATAERRESEALDMAQSAREREAALVAARDSAKHEASAARAKARRAKARHEEELHQVRARAASQVRVLEERTGRAADAAAAATAAASAR